MKRDFELIRVILLNIEEHNFTGEANEMIIDGHSFDDVAYNAHLLWERGFIEGTNAVLLGKGPNVVIRKLTWQGHDLLDSIRDATVWEKTKTLIRTKSLSLTFEAIKVAAPLALKAIFSS